jgi:phospholipase C
MTPMHRVGAAALMAAAILVSPAPAQEKAQLTSSNSDNDDTAYPIRHVVVIFQENVSFDHYFGTYSYAVNPPGEPVFTPRPGTPTVNGLDETLLTKNPNSLQPHRIDRSHVNTADQQAFDLGLMDRFVEFTGTPEAGGSPSRVMDYYDGNVVTALWNYAQHFALNDNSFGTTFGPSTPGAINLISGNTHRATPSDLVTSFGTDTVQGSVIADAQPTGDEATTRDNIQMSGRNVGDLLNAKNITWGWFQGGFDDPAATHIGSNGKPQVDYIAHHEPFQYYAQTANPKHLPPPRWQ